MKAQRLHHKPVASAILSSVDPENFAPMRLTTKALNDDSCWEECESDFEDELPSYLLNSIDDGDF
jgi:hypothetical protein